MILFHVSDFSRRFSEEFSWGIALLFQLYDLGLDSAVLRMGRKGGKNLSVSPWNYMLCFLFLATQNYIVSVYRCKDECISCHLGCFLFEVPLIELVRNANFAKHLDLDAQKRFEMEWWRWWMFLVLCSVTSNLNVGWRFFCPKWRAN